MKLQEKTKNELIAEVKKLQKKLTLITSKKDNNTPLLSNSKSSSQCHSRWDAFLKNSLNNIIIIDKKGTIIDVNRIEGPLTKSAVIGKSAYSFVSPEYLKQMKKAIKDTFSTKKTHEYQSFRIDEKGRPRYYKSRVTALIENKKVTAAVIDATEITNEILAQKQLKESEENYKHFLEQIPSATVIYVDQKAVYANKATFELLQFKTSDLKKIKNLNIFNYILPKYRKESIERTKRILQGEDLPFFEFEIKTQKGKTIYVESKSKKINYKGKDGIQTIINNIDYRKKSEIEIAQNVQNYKSLVDYSPDGVIIHSKGGVIFANPSALKILGVKKFKEIEGLSPLSYVFPEYHKEIKERRMKLKSGAQLDFMTIKIKNKKGKVSELEIKPIKIKYNGEDAFLVVFHDVSEKKQLYKEQLRAQLAEETSQKLQKEIRERKKAEDQLKKQLIKFNAVIESGSHYLWSVDRNICLTMFNSNHKKQLKNILGIDAEIGLSMITGKAISTNEVNNFWIKKYDKVFEGEAQHFEVKATTKDGKENWREIYLNPIFDDDGNVQEVSAMGHDITEKKIAEDKIRLSLKEKEVLLKEVHHRVKNNLQVISSILNLQSSYVKDEGTLNILKESQNRIKSMAFIHESLYQTKDFSSINFSEYVINLSQNLVQSYVNFDHKIKLNLDIQNVFLNLDLAIPCGLIINEIVSNALKYAFDKNHKNAAISITMFSNKEDLTLLVGDNGKGLPQNIDYKNTESLGLQLVVTLIEQLNGSIELDKTNGTNYKIVFNQNQAKNRI